MKILSAKDAAEFERLKTRCAALEARLETSLTAASDANARYDALFERYAALKDKGFTPPSPMPVIEAPPVVPTQVQTELDEFRADPDLYQHNHAWAMRELAQGAEPAQVADAIKYGVHTRVYDSVHMSVTG